MIIYSDSKEYTESILNYKPIWTNYNPDISEEIPVHLQKRLFTSTNIVKAEYDYFSIWKYVFIVDHAEQSQFSVLMDVLRDHNDFKDGILCLAGSGQNFKGYRDRKWVSLKGNIHLSIFLNPDQPVKNFHTGFTILSALSVVQTIDSIPDLKGKAAIKWVNDIIIDKAKVSGVLTQTQTQGDNVSGVFLGIGINVQTTPTLKEDIFVPQATSLAAHTPCDQADILDNLLKNIAKNYQKLVKGEYNAILNEYRQRSFIINKEITVYSDPIDGPPQITAQGKVMAIGEKLELYLEDLQEPITSGRIII